MGRMVVFLASMTVIGCASAPAEMHDETRLVVTLECLQRLNPPRDRPFEWCKLESVRPDTPATRQRAEEMVAKIGTPGRRPPADELMGAETVKYRIQLGPAEPVGDDDDG